MNLSPRTRDHFPAWTRGAAITAALVVSLGLTGTVGQAITHPEKGTTQTATHHTDTS